MSGGLPLLPSVGSAAAGTAPRADPPRLPPTKGLFLPVSVPPQYPDRTGRKRNVVRDARDPRRRPRRRPRREARPAELGGRRRARAPRPHDAPRERRLPPRPHQLRQDLRLPRRAGEERPRRLRRPAAPARARGLRPAVRAAPARHRRPLHRRGGDRPRRPDRLLHRGEGADARRPPGARRVALGRRPRPRPPLGPPGAHRRLPRDAPDLRGRGVPAAQAAGGGRQEDHRGQPQAAVPARRAARRPSAPTPSARRPSSSRSPARPSTPSPPHSTRSGPARSASSTARCRRPPAATSSTGSPAARPRCW